MGHLCLAPASPLCAVAAGLGALHKNGQMVPSSSNVDAFIQGRLRSLGLASVAAVEAARWLDQAGVLRDSPQRPGKPLREKLRNGLIPGARQEGGRWYIYRLDREAPPVAEPRDEITSRIVRGGVRASSDEAYVLELCDVLLGEKGIRQHRFDWLVGDAGSTGIPARLPVDAYYPRRGVVIEYRERQHHESTPFFDRRQTVSGVGRGEQRRLYDRRRETEIPAHGLRLVVINCHDLAVDGRGRLRRQRAADLEVLRRYLSEGA